MIPSIGIRPESNGVFVAHSQLPLAAITDGFSNTYLLGEKYLAPDDYHRNIADLGDNHSAWTGLNWDLCRTTSKSKSEQPYIYQPPQRDAKGVRNWWTFGSAHQGSLSMAFCDGHIQNISYTIDAEVHRRLGNRHDGLSIADEY
jgi:prepilin-type processing-associated H-X9-DG protein